MNRNTLILLMGLAVLWFFSMVLLYQNDNFTEREETKQMTACVESGGQWLEAEGMSAQMECVK